MGYGTVIFDMDGTILDTLEDIVDSVNVTMDHVGYPHHTKETMRRFLGNGAAAQIQRCVPGGAEDPKYAEALAFYLEYYNAHANIKTGPYPGIVQVLQTLKERGVKTAVVSNKPDATVQELSAECFTGLFDVSMGERTGMKKKPAPDSVYEAMRLLGADPNDCVYVGDSEVDMATARNSNLPCVTVTWGFRDEEFLREQGATVFAHTMEELLDALTR